MEECDSRAAPARRSVSRPPPSACFVLAAAECHLDPGGALTAAALFGVCVCVEVGPPAPTKQAVSRFDACLFLLGVTAAAGMQTAFEELKH